MSYPASNEAGDTAFDSPLLRNQSHSKSYVICQLLKLEVGKTWQSTLLLVHVTSYSSSPFPSSPSLHLNDLSLFPFYYSDFRAPDTTGWLIPSSPHSLWWPHIMLCSQIVGVARENMISLDTTHTIWGQFLITTFNKGFWLSQNPKYSQLHTASRFLVLKCNGMKLWEGQGPDAARVCRDTRTQAERDALESDRAQSAVQNGTNWGPGKVHRDIPWLSLKCYISAT